MASVPTPGGDPTSPGSVPDEIIPPMPDQDYPAPIDDPAPDQGPIETPPPGRSRVTGRRGPEDEGDDPRSDLQQMVESRKDAAEAAAGGHDTSALEDAGAEDGVGGTAGVTKNQDVAPGSPTGGG